MSGGDASLKLLVLGFVSGDVSMSQVDVAFNGLDLNVVDKYWCVVFYHHLCLRIIHLQTLDSHFLQRNHVAIVVARVVY